MRWRAVLVALILCPFLAASAVSYSWQPRAGEPAFALEVPEGWRVWEAVWRNGVVVRFRKGQAQIEVRSVAAKDAFSIAQVINQKSARLSGEYPFVRYLGERPSRYSAELALHRWEIRTQGKVLLEESAIVLSPTGPVIVSCRFLPHAEAEYRAACENAYYSLSLEEGPVKPVKKEKPTGDFPLLQDFALYHIPNNLPVPDPESLLQLLQPGKIQYDENYILPDEEYRY